MTTKPPYDDPDVLDTSGNVIYYGDSRVLGARICDPIDCIITDPPYGMAFKSNRAVTPEGKELNEEIAGDDDPELAVEIFHDVIRPTIPMWADEFEMYVFTAWHVLKWWIPAVEEIDPELELKMMGFWSKGYPGQGDLVGNWGCGHEVILYLKRGRRPVKYRRSFIITADKIPAGQNIHPTEKPTSVLTPLIEMSTDPGALIYDPFSGSGSTAKACQEMGRRSIGVESNPKYIEPSRRRLEDVGLGLI